MPFLLSGLHYPNITNIIQIQMNQRKNSSKSHQVTNKSYWRWWRSVSSSELWRMLVRWASPLLCTPWMGQLWDKASPVVSSWTRRRKRRWQRRLGLPKNIKMFSSCFLCSLFATVMAKIQPWFPWRWVQCRHLELGWICPRFAAHRTSSCAGVWSPLLPFSFYVVTCCY